MKKVIVLVVSLFALTISFQAKAQYSTLYEGEGFNVQFTYDNDGKAMEIVIKSTEEENWVKLQIVEFQTLDDDGYRYVTKNPVGNVINMEFHTND
jgi:ABC-type metal ion transport system substrate-binding protein